MLDHDHTQANQLKRGHHIPGPSIRTIAQSVRSSLDTSKTLIQCRTQEHGHAGHLSHHASGSTRASLCVAFSSELLVHVLPRRLRASLLWCS